MTRPEHGDDKPRNDTGRTETGGFRRSAAGGDGKPANGRGSERGAAQGDRRAAGSDRTGGTARRSADRNGTGGRGGGGTYGGTSESGGRRFGESKPDTGSAQGRGPRNTGNGESRDRRDRDASAGRSDRSAGGKAVGANGSGARGGAGGRGPRAAGDGGSRGGGWSATERGGGSGKPDRAGAGGSAARGGRDRGARESYGAQPDRRRGSDSTGGRHESSRGGAGNAGRAGGARNDHGADPVRSVARDVLRAVRERDAYANLVLPGLLRERRISGRDAALATELTYGACRSQGLLDAVIADCAGRSVEEIDGPLLDVLRLGTYQLLRTRIGAHAAVDTSVALARSEFGQGRAGFVNAVLRRVAERTPEEWVERLAPQDPLGHLAFEYAHPVWIAQAFADALGAEAGELREVLEADDARPAVHLVARPGDITAEELALVTGGEEGRWSPYAVYLDGGDPGKLEPVREGMAAVQDEGSQLVALAVTKAPLEGPDGGRWLDLCAGPGGKTALLAAIAEIDGFRVDAVEPAEHRAELVRKATRGMPVDVHVTDGRDAGLTPGFDRILVDAPCTGLGALRRRPEARWRRRPSDVRELVTLQRELLTAAWDLVRPGGVVVYSTCSPHLPETVSVVADMVRRTGAEQLDTRELLPGVPDLGDGPGAQLWPHRHGTDAMFLAALRKPVQQN